MKTTKAAPAIQFVTEINSESNHQYSMFASNVRSYNRKLTTLHRAARVFLRSEKRFFGDFPLAANLRPPTKNCVWWKELFCVCCLTCKVISQRGKRGFCRQNCRERFLKNIQRGDGEPGDVHGLVFWGSFMGFKKIKKWNGFFADYSSSVPDCKSNNCVLLNVICLPLVLLELSLMILTKL